MLLLPVYSPTFNNIIRYGKEIRKSVPLFFLKSILVDLKQKDRNIARDKHFDACNFMRVNSAARGFQSNLIVIPAQEKMRESGLFTTPEGFIDFDKRCH